MDEYLSVPADLRAERMRKKGFSESDIEASEALSEKLAKKKHNKDVLSSTAFTEGLTPVQLDIESLTRADFDASMVFDYLRSLINKPWEFDIAYTRLNDQAKKVKFTVFARRWKAYLQQDEAQSARVVGNVTEFSEADKYPVLNSGQWFCTDDGIFFQDKYGQMNVACTHPIMPVTQATNIDTGEVKIRLAFRLGGNWQELSVPRSFIASAQKIVSLADYGIGVTSETSKYLVQFLADVESLNYEQIPKSKSVTHLGWIDSKTFAPYSPEIVFDGQAEFLQMYEATQPKGSFSKWRELMRMERKRHPAVRMILATSFAAPLIQPLSAITSITHTWAKTTTGKTVMMKLAASIWANPDMGAFIKQQSSTSFANEQYAAFSNGVPLILDELQANKERHGGQVKFDVYRLTQGGSGGRGNKDGSLRREKKWRTTILTSGEEPISQSFDNDGSTARVIEIRLDSVIYGLELAQQVIAVINVNYGHAGRAFVNAILELGQAELKRRYDEIAKRLVKRGIQEKHAMTGAALLLADEIADEHIFNDAAGRLTEDELASYLSTSAEVNLAERAYNLIREWVAANKLSFTGDSFKERFGTIDGEFVYIMKSKLNEFLESRKYSPRAVLAEMADEGLIETYPDANGKRRFDSKVKIDGVYVRAVKMYLSTSEDGEEIEFDIP